MEIYVEDASQKSQHTLIGAKRISVSGALLVSCRHRVSVQGPWRSLTSNTMI
jgi:hypothetical protein